MAEQGTDRRDRPLEVELTVDLERRQARLDSGSGDQVLIEPRAHRAGVVMRLLELGLSVSCLRALIPQWSALILAVSDRLDREQDEASQGAGALPN